MRKMTGGLLALLIISLGAWAKLSKGQTDYSTPIAGDLKICVCETVLLCVTPETAKTLAELCCEGNVHTVTPAKLKQRSADDPEIGDRELEGDLDSDGLSPKNERCIVLVSGGDGTDGNIYQKKGTIANEVSHVVTNSMLPKCGYGREKIIAWLEKPAANGGGGETGITLIALGAAFNSYSELKSSLASLAEVKATPAANQEQVNQKGVEELRHKMDAKGHLGALCADLAVGGINPVSQEGKDLLALYEKCKADGTAATK